MLVHCIHDFIVIDQSPLNAWSWPVLPKSEPLPAMPAQRPRLPL